MSGAKKINEEQFKLVHKLNNEKKSRKDIMETTELSDYTVAKILKVRTFSEYRQLTKDMNALYRKRRSKKKHGKVTIDATMFVRIKGMIGFIKKVDIERNIGISQSTIANIEKSPTFAEYQKLVVEQLSSLPGRKKPDIDTLLAMIAKLEKQFEEEKESVWRQINELVEWQKSCRAEQKIV